jgi:hypothetical protein
VPSFCIQTLQLQFGHVRLLEPNRMRIFAHCLGAAIMQLHGCDV